MNNEEVKERKKKRKKHADKKRNEIKRMAEAVRFLFILPSTKSVAKSKKKQPNNLS